MYILVLSKIIVQEQKKGEKKFYIGQKDCSGFPISFFAKKKQNELLANTIQRNKMEVFLKRICRFPGSYNFSFNSLVEERRKGILNKIFPQEKKGVGKIYTMRREKAKSLVNSGLES